MGGFFAQDETQFLLAEVAGINQLKKENARLKQENDCTAKG